MKGDFSRRTFEPADHYSAVLIEQGRLLTDADLDEEHRILAHRIEIEAVDLIGGCGGPIGDAGFAIAVDGAGGLTISAGRYYVDGVLVENDPAVAYVAQPDRDDPPPPATLPAGRYLAVLDVWRRLITALDDPSIREVALGGPTTSARERTVWQVRLEGVAAGATCLSPLPDFAPTTGRMAAQANPEVIPPDPCLVPPTAGFKGLENQLYRVEIHHPGAAYDLTAAADAVDITAFPAGTTNQATVAGGAWTPGDAVEIYRGAAGFDPLVAELFVVVAVDAAGTTLTLDHDLPPFAPGDAPRLRRVAATFVWSRDNGSVVTAIEGLAGDEVTVRDLGPDDVRGFGPGHWVELVDDRLEREALPGQLARIAAIDKDRRVVRLTAPADAAAIDLARHPKLRRWDGAGAIRFNNPAPAPSDDWIDLEDGVQVSFVAGHYRTGDYWHFPARTATTDLESGNIAWPQTAGAPDALAPHGVDHHYCPLALVDVASGDGAPTVTVVADCRDLFPPVTELTTLLYVGGDGQEGTPDPAAPTSRSVVLDAPLEVRVANGEHPVMGAQVRFRIESGNGRLQGTNATTAVVATDANGIATCVWHLDGQTPHQQVDAHLLDAAGDPIDQQVVRFHAGLSRADRVAYDPRACPDLASATPPVATVQQAIDALCRRPSGGGRCCCVVVGPGGEFERLAEAVAALLERGESDLCLCLLPGDHDLPGWRVVNDDPRRRVNLKIAGCGPSTRIDLLDNALVRGLWSFVLSEVDLATRQNAWLELVQVRQVRLETCRVAGIRPERALVEIRDATSIYVGNSTFEASQIEVIEGALRFFDGIEGAEALRDLFARGDWRDFEPAVRDIATDLAGRPRNQRTRLSRSILARLDESLSRGEVHAYRRFAAGLVFEPVDPLALVDQLIAVREAVIRADPGIALEIGPMIGDVERALDPAIAREGALVLENNVVSGLVSLYGRASFEPLDVEFLRLLREGLQRGRARIDGVFGGAHLRNNHLTRLVVAADLLQVLRPFADGQEGTIDTLHHSLHLTDNVVDGAGNVVVARHLALTANDFTLDAVRNVPTDDVGAVPFAPNVAIADSATYTGNHGRGTGIGPVQLQDITRVSAGAANLEITIA